MTTPTLVHLSLIDDNPYQPRLSYDEAAIAETAKSIKENGLLQIPTARRVGERYQLAFGHRRRRAFSQLAESDPAYDQMPLIIRDLDDRTMVKQTWSENKDRKDITAYEEARAIDHYMRAFGWSQKQVAEELGLDRSTVTNKVGLLKLPASIINLFASGEISERQAMALKPLAELPINSWDTPLSFWFRGNKINTLNEIGPLVGKTSADELRRIVDDLLNAVSMRLERVSWPWQSPLPVAGAQNDNCKECSLRMRISNRCPSLACAELKEKAARRIQAAAAAAAERLPADAVGGYGEYDTLSGVSRSSIKKEAKDRGCGNLVVAKVSYGSHPVEGHTGYYMICKKTKCQCRAALEKSADPAKSDAARKKADRKQIRQMYKDPAETVLSAALGQLSAGLLRMILHRINYSASQKVPASADAAVLSAALAAQLVKEEIKYEEDRADLDGTRQKLELLLTLAGLELPWRHGSAQEPAQEPILDLIRNVKTCLEEASEAVSFGHPMAGYALNQAEQITAQIACHNLTTAEAYQRQIETLRATMMAPPEPEPAADVLPPATSEGAPVASFDQLPGLLDAIEAQIIAGQGGLEQERALEQISDCLDAYVDDDTVSTEVFEALLRRLDDLWLLC